MKTGKYITLDCYENVKIGYGTVDYKNLKTIYIKLNSWIQPEDELIDYNELVSKTKRRVKLRIYETKNDFFKKENIVDIDIRTKGIKMEKKSFMNIEITLFTSKNFDIKSKEIKNFIKELSQNIICNDLDNKKLFNFYKNKE